MSFKSVAETPENSDNILWRASINAMDFAGTKFGFIFTVGLITAGVAAFIVLTSTYNYPDTAAYVFMGAVFGAILLDYVLGNLGLFKSNSNFQAVPDPSSVEDSNHVVKRH